MEKEAEAPRPVRPQLRLLPLLRPQQWQSRIPRPPKTMLLSWERLCATLEEASKMLKSLRVEDEEATCKDQGRDDHGTDAGASKKVATNPGRIMECKL